MITGSASAEVSFLVNELDHRGEVGLKGKLIKEEALFERLAWAAKRGLLHLCEEELRGEAPAEPNTIHNNNSRCDQGHRLPSPSA